MRSFMIGAFQQILLGGRVKKNVMEGAYSTHRRKDICMKSSLGLRSPHLYYCTSCWKKGLQTFKISCSYWSKQTCTVGIRTGTWSCWVVVMFVTSVQQIWCLVLVQGKTNSSSSSHSSAHSLKKSLFLLESPGWLSHVSPHPNPEDYGPGTVRACWLGLHV
jgi:hypothetical protein